MPSKTCFSSSGMTVIPVLRGQLVTTSQVSASGNVRGRGISYKICEGITKHHAAQSNKHQTNKSWCAASAPSCGRPRLTVA
jgi:hypothetical protein